MNTSDIGLIMIGFGFMLVNISHSLFLYDIHKKTSQCLKKLNKMESYQTIDLLEVNQVTSSPNLLKAPSTLNLLEAPSTSDVKHGSEKHVVVVEQSSQTVYTDNVPVVNQPPVDTVADNIAAANTTADNTLAANTILLLTEINC